MRRLDLTDEEILALLNLLVETIEADRYPMSREPLAGASDLTERSALRDRVYYILKAKDEKQDLSGLVQSLLERWIKQQKP